MTQKEASDVVETEMRAVCFRSERFFTAATVAGLRIDGAGGFARARVWVEPCDPERSNAVEAAVHLWNKGLDPKIDVPAQSEVVVEVTGGPPSRVTLVRRVGA